jgi:hypothetical protein
MGDRNGKTESPSVSAWSHHTGRPGVHERESAVGTLQASECRKIALPNLPMSDLSRLCSPINISVQIPSTIQ